MSRMSGDRIFRRPKGKPPTNPGERWLDKVFGLFSRKLWADTRLTTNNITHDEYAVILFKPYHAALVELTGGRFRRVLYEGIVMKSAEPFWAWDRIQLMAQDKIDHGDKSHDWPGLIATIRSYNEKSTESPKRDLI